MVVYLCHEQPDLVEHDALVVDSRPGRVHLDRSAFHPGGGGQVSDAGWIEYGGGVVAVTGIESSGIDESDDEDILWHVLADDTVELTGTVLLRVDDERRARVASLHTDSHILNALVFDRFPGTLVTGAQINADGTGRMDFDLSQVDNDVLRGLDAGVNDIITRGVEVRSTYVDAAAAESTAGLVRSLSVAPPATPDGLLRVIDIDGVDRQACGGTHLSNTGQSAPFRITKVENKGKRNRRIRFELA
jgi:misacylated tRNA(Ala) deacylase